MTNLGKETEYDRGFEAGKTYGGATRFADCLVGFLVGFAIALMLCYVSTAHANTATVTLTVPCTNQNWQHSPRCTAPPVLETMIINPWGVSSGELKNGVKWTQTRVTKDMALFEMEEVRYVVYKDMVVYLD